MNGFSRWFLIVTFFAMAGSSTHALGQESPAAQPSELTPAREEAIPGASAGVPALSEPALTANRVALFDTCLVEVGTRIMHIALLDDKQGKPFEGSFIGSINELDPNQDYIPWHPYLQILFPVDQVLLGAGLTYDELSVATVDSGGGDGDVEMDAWTLYLILAYPNESRWTAFGEIGLARYSNSFDPIPSWYAGGRRNFVFADSTAFHLAGGCDYAFSERLSANLYLRYVAVELDGEYVFRGDNRDPEPFTFPMDHLAWGLGIKYAF